MAALSREPAMQVAQDKAPTKLLFKKLQTVSGWQEIVVIALGDQARNNRPDAVPQAAWLLSLEDLGIFKDDQVRCRSFHPGGWGVLQFRRTTRPHPM